MHYRHAAERGDVESMVRLAGILGRGDHGYTVNKAESFKWYLAAARQGDAVAQCNVAAMYASGSGVTKDDREAFMWYGRSAEGGNAQAQYNYALMNLSGKGTWKNVEEALRSERAGHSLLRRPRSDALVRRGQALVPGRG